MIFKTMLECWMKNMLSRKKETKCKTEIKIDSISNYEEKKMEVKLYRTL